MQLVTKEDASDFCLILVVHAEEPSERSPNTPIMINNHSITLSTIMTIKLISKATSIIKTELFL